MKKLFYFIWSGIAMLCIFAGCTFGAPDVITYTSYPSYMYVRPLPPPRPVYVRPLPPPRRNYGAPWHDNQRYFNRRFGNYKRK